MILGACKNLGITPQEALDMEYVNLLLYSAAMPRYNSKSSSDGPRFDPSLDANDPNNFKDVEIE